MNLGNIKHWLLSDKSVVTNISNFGKNPIHLMKLLINTYV